MNTRSLLTALALPLFALPCLAQTEAPDSVSLAVPDYPELVEPQISPMTSGELSGRYWLHNPEIDPMLQYRIMRPLDLHISGMNVVPGEALLANWNNGAVIASGGIAEFPGLMQMESGAIGVTQTAGRFTFYAGGMANKYGYLGGLNTQYGVQGRVSYLFSPRLTFTVFGSYYFGNTPPLPTAVLGYYGRSNFGGTFDYKINDHWGVEVGAQAVQQAGTRRFEAEPIATPYYKINKKVKIGIPAGQILYHLLKR